MTDPPPTPKRRVASWKRPEPSPNSRERSPPSLQPHLGPSHGPRSAQPPGRQFRPLSSLQLLLPSGGSSSANAATADRNAPATFRNDEAGRTAGPRRNLAGDAPPVPSVVLPGSIPIPLNTLPPRVCVRTSGTAFLLLLGAPWSSAAQAPGKAGPARWPGEAGSTAASRPQPARWSRHRRLQHPSSRREGRLISGPGTGCTGARAHKVMAAGPRRHRLVAVPGRRGIDRYAPAVSRSPPCPPSGGTSLAGPAAGLPVRGVDVCMASVAFAVAGAMRRRGDGDELLLLGDRQVLAATAVDGQARRIR